MTRAVAIAGAVGLSVMANAAPALAGPQVYTYSVEHPIYGEIGTLTDMIERDPEVMRINARLRVAVTLLGIVAYREESDTTEVLRGNRLVSLESVTNKDGRHLEVHGEAQGDRFVVNTTMGSYAAPASIVPSDPWLLKHTGEGLMVSTGMGRMLKVQISGGEYDIVSMSGAPVSARHYVVTSDKRQDVWLDDREIPIKFRIVEDGTPIDFVLQNVAAASATSVAALRRSASSKGAQDDK